MTRLGELTLEIAAELVAGPAVADLVMDERDLAEVSGDTFADGLDMSLPREDGRRCLDAGELEAAGWHRDRHGRWRQAAGSEGHWSAKGAPRRLARPRPDQGPISNWESAA